MHTVQLTTRAAKQLRRLPKDRRRHVTRVLDRIAEDPYRHGRRLKGEFTEYWRARAGEYRVVYMFESDSVTFLSACLRRCSTKPEASPRRITDSLGSLIRLAVANELERRRST